MMKTIFVLLIFLAAVTGIRAQEVQAKALVETLYSSQRTAKGAPFAATAVSENAQTLADGNRIVRRSTSKLFRDSEGRYRREDMQRTLGVADYSVPVQESITIIDPVAGFVYTLNPKENTGRKSPYRAPFVYTVAPDAAYKLRIAELDKVRAYTLETQKETTAATPEAAKAKAERDAQRVEQQAERLKAMAERQAERASTMAARQAELETAVTARGFSVTAPFAVSSKYETKTESLGVQNIEGVQAEGTRSVTTIPAGAIGNERPIEIVYEKWYSKDLQMIVMSKHSDPRSGEQTYRLTEIRREEPALILFSPPAEYKITEASMPKARVLVSPKPVTPVLVKVAPTAPKPATAPVQKNPNDEQ
jgi:hypothetical protein